jgi:hypothetical protein
MKTLIVICLAIVTTLIGSAPALAGWGGIGDGGGSGIGSTEDEVIKGVAHARLALGDYLHLASSDPTNPLNPTLVKDPVVQKVLQSWLAKEGDSEAIVQDELATQYKTLKAECPSDTDDDHDASTPHRRKAPICFSTPLLQRFPAWTLPAELVALAAHEHAHHFGYGEAEARAVQHYVFSAYGLLQVHRLADQFFNMDTDNYRSRIKLSGGNSTGEAGFVKTICRDFYSLVGQATAFNIKAFSEDLATRPVCDLTNFDADAVDQRLRDLIAASIHDLN